MTEARARIDDRVVKNDQPCTASLGAAFMEAAPAFDRACQAVAIDGDD